jgi:sugar phosphate isomerase/epimerase
MNKLSVRAHDVGKMAAADLVLEVKALGFEGIQLVIHKALTDPIDITDEATLPVALSAIPIDLLGGYFNMVHPDLSVVEEGISTFEALLRLQPKIRAAGVGTETGSLMGSPWGYVPENHLTSSFERVVSVVKRLVKTAEASGSTVLIEGAWAHVVYSPKQMKKLLDRIASDRLRVIVDLFNYLNIDNHGTHVDLLKECLDLFSDKIQAFHLKDYVLKDHQLVQTALGDGLMNYEQIIPLIQAACPDAPLIFEGVRKEDMARSIAFIRAIQRRTLHV